MEVRQSIEGSRRQALWVLGGLALAGCSSAPVQPARDEWHEVRIPGKHPTRYTSADKRGRGAVYAQANRSASMWRKRVHIAPEGLAEVSFSWWVDSLIAGADVSRADSEDAPARVLFGFGGDARKLPARTRMMFELAEALTGEPPPYATLMYVWANEAPLDSVIVNPRTDRIRKIVADSGPAQLGRWRDHRRHLVRDFERAFGEAPGPLTSIGLMTDGDNTGSHVRAWYGPIRVGTT